MANTTFRTTVYEVVKTIPPGSTMTYAEVAKRIGKPEAARAVAQALAANFDETIPCHRVIRSDGSLGGYNRGGEVAKRAILQTEGWQSP